MGLEYLKLLGVQHINKTNTPPPGFHSGSLAFTTFHLQEVFSHCSTLLPGASEESHLHPCKLGSLSFIGNQLQ